MKFKFRLAYYLAGFSIGMVFVFFILNGKDASCSYFPNARVLKHLRSKPFVYSKEAQQKMAQPWVDTVDIKQILTHGKVDFDQSVIKSGTGKFYVVHGKNTANEPLTLKIKNFTDRAVLEDIVRQ
jgi:hypothetical protein